jgi:hypothetical protein
MRSGVVLLAGVFLASCASQPPAHDPTAPTASLPMSGDGSIDAQCVVPIAYHGGPVIQGTFNIYYIWYGNWSSNTALDILPDLASNIGGSPYYNINTTYGDTTGVKVANSVKFAGSFVDSYSRGKNISDGDVKTIVSDAINGAKLPSDTNGIYYVLSSSDVNETSGFCMDYCGFHKHATIGTSNIRYAFVGNPDRCPAMCELKNTTVSPNNNPGADAMASTIAGELNRAATDPDGNAWYFDADGFENTDQCAWTYGSTVKQPNGSAANVTLGTRNYLLQRNWLNVGCGKCAISY